MDAAAIARLGARAADAGITLPVARVQDTVAGRVAHIDGDFLAYWAGSHADTPAGVARNNARDRLDFWRAASGAATCCIDLTARDSNKGGRFLVATTQGYQEQRHKTPHPPNWYVMREFLEGDACPCQRAIWKDREADDGMACASWHSADPVAEVAIVTKDKDMRMLAGLHVDWDTGALTEVPAGTYEVIGGNGKVYGHKWFWLQMLQGDAADNIPNVRRGVGPVAAGKLLAGTTCNAEAWEVVWGEYQDTYGVGGAAAALVERAALLWLRGSRTAQLHDFLRVVPDIPPIRRATRQLQNRVRRGLACEG